MWYNIDMKVWRRLGLSLLIALMVVVAGFLSFMPALALTDEQLMYHSQNGIYVYDPGNKTPGSVSGCNVLPNGIFRGEQYSLSEEDMKALARAAMNENNCNLTAFKNELSLMANLYERGNRREKYPTLIDYIRDGGWFADSTVRALDNTSRNVPDDRLQAVKDVLVDGNRTLPPQIVEHDCLGDLDWIEVNGVKYEGINAGNCKGDKNTQVFNKSLYLTNTTKIHNKYGATYIFYTWAGGGEACSGEDPFGYYPSNPPDGSYSTVASSKNSNYAGTEVWSSADLQAVEANKSFYESAAKKYGFSWQILAVIHYRENNLLRNNPANGRGAYGVSNGEEFLPAGKIDDEEFQRQTDIAAGIIAEKAKEAGISLASLTDGNIQKIFYLYDGVYEEYNEKGKQLGLTEEQIANGGGSPYVMNKYDAKRDPGNASMSPYWAGVYRDGVYDSGATDSKFGAYVLYQALMGDSYCEASGGSVADTAMQLSWEGLYSHDKNDPKAEYVTAMKEVGAYQQGNGYYPYGASCDQFVGTVMRYSGADKEFPIWGPQVQREYMVSHSEKYEKVNANGDYSALQPGDIFVTTNAGAHIYIYVGIINGEMTQASASADDRTAEHFGGAGAVYFSDNGLESNGNQVRYYEVFRRIQ